jgi:hypothetical protein
VGAKTKYKTEIIDESNERVDGVEESESKGNNSLQSSMSNYENSIMKSDVEESKQVVITELERVSVISKQSEFRSEGSCSNLMEYLSKDDTSMKKSSKLENVFGITPTGFDKKFKSFISSNTNSNLSIMLPKISFEVDELTLTTDLSFIGSPETQLTVTKGPIAIKSGTVLFKECVFLLDVDEGSIEEKNTPKRLFEVWNGAQLQLVDCLLKIDNKDARDEICIYIHSQSYGKTGGLVKITSCSISNFFSQIIAGSNSQVSIDNCAFSKSNNSSLLIINPLQFSIKNSNFDDIGASAIEIRFTQSKVLNSVFVLYSN